MSRVEDSIGYWQDRSWCFVFSGAKCKINERQSTVMCFLQIISVMPCIVYSINQSINQTFITDSRSRFKKDNKQHIQPIGSIATIKSYKIQQYQCLHSFDWYRVVLTLIFDKPTIISFWEALSRQINLCIRFRNSALKVITLTLTNISLALCHLGLLSKIVIASL